jgi:hypothetical protein
MKLLLALAVPLLDPGGPPSSQERMPTELRIGFRAFAMICALTTTVHSKWMNLIPKSVAQCTTVVSAVVIGELLVPLALDFGFH